MSLNYVLPVFTKKYQQWFYNNFQKNSNYIVAGNVDNVDSFLQRTSVLI